MICLFTYVLTFAFVTHSFIPFPNYQQINFKPSMQASRISRVCS